MAEQLGQAVLTISADTRQLDAGLQRARQQAEALRGAFAQIAGGLSIAGSLAFVGNQIKELDAASAAVRTLGVNSEELKTRLQALSIELGSTVSQIELTKAAYDVASSGFANAADTAQILRASVQGARGGFAQLDDVVRATTGILNAYGLSADQATKIVDGFIQTQNDGVLTLGQYANQVGDVASIAAAAGVSIGEVNAAIGTATLKSVLLPQAVTGLRQALSSIINPSQQAAQLANSLGIQFNAAAIKSKGLVGVLADVQEKTGGSAEKFGILFPSVEAQAVILPLLNDRLATYNKLLENQNKASGTAAKSTKINSDTISGSLTQIGNGFSNLATTLDKTLTPLFAGFISGLNDILTKLNQVSALSPKAVERRESEATRIVETAKRNSPNFNTRAFFGTPLVSPNTEIVFDGKTFKGTITGVRNELVKYLLTKDLADINKPNKAAARPTPKGNPPPDPGATLSPAQANFIQQTAAVELRGLQEKLEITRQLAGLNEAERTRLQNRLTLNDKIRAVQQTQLQLGQELAKPKGSTGSPTEQDPAKLLDLQNKLTQGQVEVATLRLQNQQADAAALRTQQDRLRGQSLEAANARAKLGATQQQTQLERQALAAGVEVSRTAQLRLQQEEAIAAAKRQQASAQQALDAELQKPIQQQDRVVVDDLFSKVARANEGVRQAYADAGLALVQNARSAADALRNAQQNFSNTARGGFEFLTPRLQEREMAAARRSIQQAVNANLIREGIDISTPDRLFRVAGFADQINGAQQQLQNAMVENAKATAALARKNWQVYVSVPGQPTFVPLSNV